MIRIGLRDQRHVDLAAAQQRMQLYGWRADHPQVDFRVGCAEAAQQLRQEGDGIVFRASKADGSLKDRLAHIRKDFIMPGKQRIGMRKQLLSRRSHPHSRTRSLQQAAAHLFLKPLHLRAERRLRAPDLHGGDADGAGAGDDDEVL